MYICIHKLENNCIFPTRLQHAAVIFCRKVYLKLICTEPRMERCVPVQSIYFLNTCFAIFHALWVVKFCHSSGVWQVSDVSLAFSLAVMMTLLWLSILLIECQSRTLKEPQPPFSAVSIHTAWSWFIFLYYFDGW